VLRWLPDLRTIPASLPSLAFRGVLDVLFVRLLFEYIDTSRQLPVRGLEFLQGDGGRVPNLLGPLALGVLDAPTRLRAYRLGRCSPSGPRAYLQLSVSVPSYPGGPFGPWRRWAPDLCRWR